MQQNSDGIRGEQRSSDRSLLWHERATCIAKTKDIMRFAEFQTGDKTSGPVTQDKGMYAFVIVLV